jgi:hypothetical protein
MPIYLSNSNHSDEKCISASHGAVMQLQNHSWTIASFIEQEKRGAPPKVRRDNDSIRYLSALTNKIQLLENKYHYVATVVSTQISLRESNESGNTFLGMLNQGDSVILYTVEDDEYLARGHQFIGVIPKTSIGQTRPIIRFNKLVAKMIKEQRNWQANNLLFTILTHQRELPPHPTSPGPVTRYIQDSGWPLLHQQQGK